ncbi:UDP-N-acetylmuramoyl-L-alanyl-D-glutamate--2,6-diaminopimelate ligase [Spartinivicinus poritis]|uniref:UDP-N-acetylmuramoyl-L-alanyl-D-glutamate--2,6-diaminopimelate ligase n=1 Tax=Spartinivicinus poritis TaxID=2994640 RepID=A0ABT5U8U1_9GAMM|nr:UDP-N-acetylmuramoyl-L-alanyl-D-glutamate--2,6-diaminopimelate ligase [Spartinivicinus sp. A2-2]MDE1462785.1 UDP-N-acetylmuramoyl-L-alanyl-D-glutamate--2,6-diaminopimelate ligase [Spartinivicinus sp. A2-2]
MTTKQDDQSVLKLPMMPLSRLLAAIGQAQTGFDPILSGIAIDSRQVKPGDLFIAMQGYQVDGRRFIADAFGQGAVAVLAEQSGQQALGQQAVIEVPQLNKQLGKLLNEYFGYVTNQINILGITGTNGKTSCSQFARQLLNKLNINCGVVGTLGYGTTDSLIPLVNTTPDALQLHQFIYQLVNQQVPYLAMEVSSHGLAQGRVESIAFDVAIFTNLTRDHLDYHQTMEDYAAAKAQLFTNIALQHAVINQDDPYAQQMLAACHPACQRWQYSLQNTRADVVASQIRYLNDGIAAVIESPWGKGEIYIPLLGHFNLANVLAVITGLAANGIEFNRLLDAAETLKPVTGRLQTIKSAESINEKKQKTGKPTIVVDYAHTSDALVQLLKAVRLHSNQKIICVFGCGGDRDKGKRPEMAQAAYEYADHLVITSDNPRTEKPGDIIDDIRQGLPTSPELAVDIIEDRSEAIQQAIQSAQSEDIVVIAGKGHENYQEIMGKRLPFSDFEQATQALLNWSSHD